MEYLNTILLIIIVILAGMSFFRKKDDSSINKEQLEKDFKAIADDLLVNQTEVTEKKVEDTLDTILEGFGKVQKEKFDTMSSKTKDMTDLITRMELDRKESVGKQTELIRTMLSSTDNISRVMNSPGPRGKWGEMRVRQILEAAGFKEDVHFIHNKKSELGTDRPDFVINGADGKKIILDAKVPFTAFEESTKTEDLNEVKRLHKKHAAETRGHMDKLAKSSYWNQYEDAAPFVLMVLPAEALLYAAFQADDSLFKDGIDKQIYICSPLNLLATMQVIAQGHVHVKQNEDARKITTAARDLLKVISIFNGHFKAIGMHTERLFKSFNKGAKTLEVKVKPKLEKLSDMGIELEKGKEVDPGIKMIEDGPINIFEDEDIELSENSEK